MIFFYLSDVANLVCLKDVCQPTEVYGEYCNVQIMPPPLPQSTQYTCNAIDIPWQTQGWNKIIVQLVCNVQRSWWSLSYHTCICYTMNTIGSSSVTLKNTHFFLPSRAAFYGVYRIYWTPAVWPLIGLELRDKKRANCARWEVANDTQV